MKKKLLIVPLLFLIGLVFGTNLHAQGETCGTPLTVLTLPYTHTGSTGDYGNNYTSADVAPVAPGAITAGTGTTTYLNGSEAVYAITPTAAGTVSIDLTADTSWSGIWVFTGCPFASTVGYHVTTSGLSRSVPNLPVVANETYYVVISNWDQSNIDYTISITGTPGVLAPLDDCDEAVAGAITSNLTAVCPAAKFTLIATGMSDYATGLVFQWQSSPAGGTNWSDITGANGINYTANAGILAETDFRLKANCSFGNLEDISNTVTVQLSPASDCHCTPIYSSGCGAGSRINGVSTTGAIINISNLATGCGSTSAPLGFSDYSNDAAFDLTIAEGTSFNLKVDVSNYSGGVKVWIDYNQNGVFEASELVTASAATISSGNSHTALVTVPIGTLNGETKMRVRVVESSTSFDPCESKSYGEAEDYKITISAPPSCFPPTNLVVSNLTNSGSTVGWTAGAAETNWSISWGTPGFTPGGTNQVGTDVLTTNFFAITGLTANTAYDVYVQSDCGLGDLSTWFGPMSFTTMCDATTVPYLLDFNGVTTPQLPTCTSIENTSIGKDWITKTAPTGFTGKVLNYSYHPSTPTGAANSWFFTQGVQLFAGVDYTISYLYGNNTTGYTESMKVAFGTSATESAMTNPLADYPAISLATPAEEELVFTVTTDGVYYFGFNSYSIQNQNQLYVDDILIDLTPTCIQPTDLIVDGVTEQTVDITWTAGASETDWIISWGTPGFTPGDANQAGTDVSTANSYEITGLTGSTNYDIYVQSDCGNGDVSYWTGPLNAFTGYCQVSTSNGEYLKTISSAGAITDITYTATAQPAGSYSDQTALVLEALESQTFNMSTDYSSGTNGVNVWVDWDDNLVFETSELMASVTGATQHNFTVTVPAGTVPGDYRMRVRGQWGSAANPPACGNVNYGSTVDFTLTVLTPPTCPPPSALATSIITESSADLTWTAGGGESNWNISWGEPGYTPGDANEIGTGVSTTNSFGITGLTEDTNYDIYVQADCGSNDESYWTGPLTVFTGYCTVSTTYSEYLTSIVSDGAITDVSYTATSQPTGSYANETALIFRATEGMTFDVNTNYSSGTNGVNIWVDWDNSMTFEPAELMASANGSTLHSLSVTVPAGQAPGNYRMRVRGQWGSAANPPACGNVNYGSTVDFKLTVVDCDLTPGVGGSADICRADNTIDLSTLITSDYTDGIWKFAASPGAINGSIFNVSSLPSGSYDVLYVVDVGCASDTTIATVNVFGPSAAGTGQSVTACRNEPINLYAALSGNVDMGGDWYDYNGGLLPNSQPIAPNLSAQYNYNYITTNGVCPADTAIVEVNVGTCDYLTIVEEMFTEISVYPNPATSKLNIVNPSNTSSLKVELLDMNGRVVLVENKALNNASEATIAIDHLERGIYTLRVYNDEGQRTFKVVKQ